MTPPARAEGLFALVVGEVRSLRSHLALAGWGRRGVALLLPALLSAVRAVQEGVSDCENVMYS